MFFLCCRDLQYAAFGGIKLVVSVGIGKMWLAVDFQLRRMTYWMDGKKWWLCNEAEWRIMLAAWCWRVLTGVEWWTILWNRGLFYQILDVDMIGQGYNLADGWTGWSVRRNGMAVQMPNLGILEFLNLWILESLDCGIVTRDLESLGLGTIVESLLGYRSLWIMDPLLMSWKLLISDALLEFLLF